MSLNDPRTNFLFWNLQGKPLTQNIVRIAESHDVHVLLFAETAFQDNASTLEDALNAGPRPSGAETFSSITESSTSRVQIFSRLKHPQWVRQITHKCYDVWSLTTDAEYILHLAAVHFLSVQVDQGDGQRRTALELRTDIESLQSERSESECPVIVCGDFNASPFDPGLVGIYGLNASPSREVVQRSGGRRTLHERSYPYLYNPMWRLLGGSDGKRTAPSARDGAPKIYGTYYNSNLRKSVDPFWYTLDQVLVSPSLLPFFHDEDLRVLTRDADAERSGVSLVSPAGIPKAETYSDHLPLVFSVHL